MRKLLLTILLIVGVCFSSQAQFQKNRLNTNTGANTMAGPPGSETMDQTTGDTPYVPADSLQGFSLKRLFRGYAHKDTLTAGYLALGTAVLPGAAQMYNHQYWKLPIVYGGIGAGIAGGVLLNKKYNETGDQKYKTFSTISYAGAGLFYWGQLVDGIATLKTDYRKPVPAKAALFSALLPGLGQAYNGDWWKIPIWYGGFAACGYFYHMNNIEYKRFKYIYDMGNDPTSGYEGRITASQAEWYKTTYRRYRDYSVVAFVLVYALNIIDASVFASMHDFEVSDNIASLEVQPTVISPLNAEYAHLTPKNSQPAFGLNLSLKF